MQLGNGDAAPLPGLQRVVGECSDTSTNEPGYGMPDRLAHSSDLPIPTLVENEPEKPGRKLRDLRGCGATVVEFDAVTEFTQRSSWRLAFDADEVLLVDTERRVGQPMRQ